MSLANLGSWRYDMMQTTSTANGNKNGETAQTNSTMSVVQIVQKAVNNSRRANGRVKRLEMELEQKSVQWDEFQKLLKQTYTAQLAQFEADQQKMEKEIAEARQAAKEAEMRLKEVAGPGEDALMEVKEKPQGNQALHPSWWRSTGPGEGVSAKSSAGGPHADSDASWISACELNETR